MEPKWHEHLQEHPRASVAAAVEKNQLTAEWPRQTYNIPGFPELSTAAAKVSADVVLVVTNPSQHKPVILQAVGLGKDVLIEKQMVTSMAKAAGVAAAADNQKKASPCICQHRGSSEKAGGEAGLGRIPTMGARSG